MIRRTVESRKYAAIRTFASATSRKGSGRLSLRSPSVPSEPRVLQDVVQLDHVRGGEYALGGNPIHRFEVPDPLRDHASYDLAPLDLRVSLHLPVKLVGDRERDVGHGGGLC